MDEHASQCRSKKESAAAEKAREADSDHRRHFASRSCARCARHHHRAHRRRGRSKRAGALPAFRQQERDVVGCILEVVFDRVLGAVTVSQEGNALERLRRIGQHHTVTLSSDEPWFVSPLFDFVVAPEREGLRERVRTLSLRTAAAVASIIEDGKVEGSVRPQRRCATHGAARDGLLLVGGRGLPDGHPRVCHHRALNRDARRGPCGDSRPIAALITGRPLPFRPTTSPGRAPFAGSRTEALAWPPASHMGRRNLTRPSLCA